MTGVSPQSRQAGAHATLPPSSAQAGFALLEVMVALALLAGAVVALAGLTVIAARANRLSRVGTLGGTLASQKMEQLLGLAWGYGPAGEDHVDVSTNASVWPEAAGGGGLAESPEGTLTSNTDGYVDYLDEHGRWLGTGTLPPAAAVYARRWSIRPLSDSPLDTLLIRVVVLMRGPAADLGTSLLLPADAVQLTCARFRRGP